MPFLAVPLVTSRFCQRAAAYRLILLVLLVFANLSLFGQVGSASISGTIVDRSGALVPDTQVKVVNEETNATFETKTNRAGVYNIPALKPGPYRIRVTRQGFKQIEIRGVTLNTQDSVNRNFTLDVGASSETITVNANAQHLETDNPAVGVLVSRDFVENMPLNGRSFQDLVALAPGTVSSNQQNGRFSVNGQRDDANYFSVDGVSANIDAGVGFAPGQATAGVVPSQTAQGTTQSLASVDALQEFRVQTSTYSAEYGRQPGAQVEITSRSGTNEFHGSIFDYFRNEAFDANNWFANANHAARQPERQNDFGGTLGGPLSIPDTYHGSGKTFFFVAYEGLRLRLPEFVQEFDPTLAFRQSSALGVQPFLNSYPLPNGPSSGDGVTGLVNAGYSNPSSIETGSVRLDHSFGSRVQIFGRFAATLSETSTRNQPVSDVDTVTTNTYTTTIGTTVRLATNLLGEFRFNYSESGGHFGSTVDSFGGAVPFNQSLLSLREGRASISGGTIVFVGPFGSSANCCGTLSYNRLVNQQTQYNIVSGVSWTHGKHSIKAGVDYRRLLPVYRPDPFFAVAGLFSLTGVQQGFADFIATTAAQPAYPVFDNLSLYGADHWKISPRLALDYGVRWEVNPAPGSRNGILPLAVNEVSDLSRTQVSLTGTPLYATKYANFAPRLGFSYQLTPSIQHPLTLRGGFGVFYDTGQALGAAGYQSYPFTAVSLPISNAPLPASASVLAPPPSNFPLMLPYGALSGVMDPHLTLPYTYQWNTAIEQGLTTRNWLTVSYVGDLGRRLLSQQEYSISSINPNFTTLAITDNAGSSSYNALQVQDQGFVAPGLQLVASYTWAHALDNVSLDNGVNLSVGGLRHGNSDSDLRQVFNIALVYRIPGSDSSTLLKVLTRGWVITGRTAVQTGYPIQVLAGTYGNPVTGLKNLTIGVDVVPGVPIYHHGVPNVPGGWELNAAAFTPVPVDPSTGVPLRQGSLGRNVIHGPNFWVQNVAMERIFHLHEQLNLSFRVDAFNCFNHPNFTAIDNFLGDLTFGRALALNTIGVANQLYATGGPRSLQLMLRLSF